MKIVRYCGQERLPRGEGLWRRLARHAAYGARLEVYGYGVWGAPGREHRVAARTGAERGITLADFRPGVIRVWLPCVCAAAEFDPELFALDTDDPLSSFAHELGHHRQYEKGRERFGPHAEAAAERYGQVLLRSVL